MFLWCLARGMLPQPPLRWPVAVFAGNTVRNFERPPALFRRSVQGVARQTLRCLLGLGRKLKDARHALANASCQRLMGPAMLLLNDPGAIFVLQNAAARDRFDAAVATRCSAGARSYVFSRLANVRTGSSGSRRPWAGLPRSGRTSVHRRSRKRRQAAHSGAPAQGNGGVSHSEGRKKLIAYIRAVRGSQRSALPFSRRLPRRTPNPFTLGSRTSSMQRIQHLTLRCAASLETVQRLSHETGRRDLRRPAGHPIAVWLLAEA